MTARPETAPGGHYRGVSDDGLIRRIRATGKTPFQIRSWAEQHGVPVPARGVIVDEHVLDAYETEHQEGAPCPPTTPSQRSPRTPPAATSTSKTPKPSPAPASPTTTPGTETASATPGPAPTTTSTPSTTPTAPSPTPTTTAEQPPTTETQSSADEHARLTAAGVSPATADILANLISRSTLHPVDVAASAGIPDEKLRAARARRLGVHGLPIARLQAVVDRYDDLFATTTDPLLAALDAARAELDRLTRRTA